MNRVSYEACFPQLNLANRSNFLTHVFGFLVKSILLTRLISLILHTNFVMYVMNKGIIKYENLFLCFVQLEFQDQY